MLTNLKLRFASARNYPGHHILYGGQSRRDCSIMLWGSELSGGGRRPGTSHLRVFSSESPPDRNSTAGPAETTKAHARERMGFLL